jgi:hypothetical protein
VKKKKLLDTVAGSGMVYGVDGAHSRHLKKHRREGQKRVGKEMTKKIRRDCIPNLSTGPTPWEPKEGLMFRLVGGTLCVEAKRKTVGGKTQVAWGELSAENVVLLWAALDAHVRETGSIDLLETLEDQEARVEARGVLNTNKSMAVASVIKTMQRLAGKR